MMASVSSMASITSGPSGGHVERLLAKHKDAILRELNLDSVVPVLMDKGIFEAEEKDDIFNGKTNEERVSKFVELLSGKGIGSFHDFCSSLEKSHPHLLTSFLLDSCSTDFAPSPTPFDDSASTMTTPGLEDAIRERDRALSEQSALRRERNEARRRVEELRAERDALAGVINANFTKGSSVSPNLNRTNGAQAQGSSMTTSRDSLVDSGVAVSGGSGGGGQIARSRSPNRRLLWEKLRALEAGAANFVSSTLPGGGGGGGGGGNGGGSGSGDAVDGALQGIDVGERVSWDVHSVTLTRVPPYGFGIAVSGGRDNPHFEDGDPSIAISDVLKAGPAEKKLRINDRIVSANGVSLENVDHHQAIQVLQECGETVHFLIKRRVVTPELVPVTVNLTRSKKKEDFGLVLGYQLYVREIVPNSLAAIDGSLHEGDVVVKINSSSSDMLSLVEARKQIDKAKDKLSLSVLRMALPDSSGSTLGRHSRNASQLSELGFVPEKDVNSKANTLTSSSVSPRGGGGGSGGGGGNNAQHSLNGRGSMLFLPVSPPDDNKPSNLDRRPPNHNNNLLHNGFPSNGNDIGVDSPDAASAPTDENYTSASCAAATGGAVSSGHLLTSPTDLGSPILPTYNNAVRQEFVVKSLQGDDDPLLSPPPAPPPVTSTPSQDLQQQEQEPPIPPPKKKKSAPDALPASPPPPPVESYMPFVPRVGVEAAQMANNGNNAAAASSSSSCGHYATVGRRRSKKRSTSSSNDPEPKTVCFRKSGASIGFRLAGGNKTGVFVSNVQPSSTAALAGLQAGEKIVRVNDIDVAGLTREEALLLLLGLQDNVQMVTQFKREEFDEIVTNSLGDSLFMRAFFNHSPKEGGEMSFVRGDVFHVTNTLHNGVVGAWQAARVGRGNKETQRGIIPNKTRAEQIAEEQRKVAAVTASNSSSNIASGTASVGRRASWFRRRSKRSKSLSKDHWDDVIFAPVDPVSGKRPAYERVALKHPGFVRPIVIFGPVADVARHLLLRDAAQAFESPQIDPDADQKKKKNDNAAGEAGGGGGGGEDEGLEAEINTPKSGIIKIKLIKEILKRDKHCLLDVTPAAVDRLRLAQLYPIVIFLRADTKHAVKAIRSHMAKGSRKSSRKLFETSQKLDEVYSHIFTSSVSLAGEEPTAWYHKLREVIDRQQRDPVWISESALDDEDELNDEYLFPMGTRLSYASSPDSDGEFAAYSSRPGSIADDEKGQSILRPPPPPLNGPSVVEDVSSTPRRTGGVADGATEEDQRKDQLLRRSFSSPSVAEEADLQGASAASIGAYPPESSAASLTQVPLLAISNSLKEELEARLKKQGMESSGGHRGSIAMGTTSARMRSNQQRDEYHFPKGVNAVATIRSTKKHGSAQEQLERQLSASISSQQMSAMERLRPGVTTLPSKPIIKGAANGNVNAATIDADTTEPAEDANGAEILNISTCSQGSAGGTIQKKDSFKNHDPYRFTRSTAYPYNSDSIDRLKFKKNLAKGLSVAPDSPTSSGPCLHSITAATSTVAAPTSPLAVDSPYFPSSSPTHPAPLSPPLNQPFPAFSPGTGAGFPPPPPSPPVQAPPDIPKERVVGGSLKARPNVPPKPRGFSLKVHSNRTHGPPSYNNIMTQSDYGRFPIGSTLETSRRPPPPPPHPSTNLDANDVPLSPPPPPPLDSDRQTSAAMNRPKSYPNNKDAHMKEFDGRDDDPSAPTNERLLNRDADNGGQNNNNNNYHARDNLPVNRANANFYNVPQSAPPQFLDAKSGSNPYFPPPPAFSDHQYQQQHQHPHPFPPPSSSTLQYPSSSTPISSASYHPPPPPPPQYQNLTQRDAYVSKSAPRQPPPPPPPKTGLKTAPTLPQQQQQQRIQPYLESPYSMAPHVDNNNGGANHYHRPSLGNRPPLAAQLSYPNVDANHGYAAGIGRMDSGYGTNENNHHHSYLNLNGGSMHQLTPSTSTFAAYGTKAPPDGIEDPYGTSRRSRGDGGSAESDAQQHIVATAKGIFDSRGGTLESEETGVSIVIPPGSIPENQTQELYFKVCSRGRSPFTPPHPPPHPPPNAASSLNKRNGETLLSPLVMCGPQGLRFNKPVELRLPHCASVSPDGGWSFSLRAAQSTSDAPTDWQQLDNLTHLGRDSVSVLVDHF